VCWSAGRWSACSALLAGRWQQLNLEVSLYGAKLWSTCAVHQYVSRQSGDIQEAVCSLAATNALQRTLVPVPRASPRHMHTARTHARARWPAKTPFGMLTLMHAGHNLYLGCAVVRK